ncbi:MAG: hypothetical protein AB1476_05550, partial [Candidatus Hadarchaeota archaeon]
MISSIVSASREIDGGLDDALAIITERILQQRERRQKIAETLEGLSKINLNVDGLAEQSLVNEVEMHPLKETAVAGVDGGLLEQQLHGLDLIMVRALAVIFHYRDAKLEKAE